LFQVTLKLRDSDIRSALDRHWAASDANSFEVERQIYKEDPVLDYPQSGERIRGRQNIEACRVAQPNKKRFMVRRIVGTANLWVTEFILSYDGQPSYSVGIMEFENGKVTHETQYLGDPFEPGPSRARWVERLDRTDSARAT
jgi:hypothetical protein